MTEKLQRDFFLKNEATVHENACFIVFFSQNIKPKNIIKEFYNSKKPLDLLTIYSIVE